MHPRNVGSDKIVRKNVRPPLYVSLGEAVYFKHPCILVVNHMATWTFREKKQQHSWVWFFNLILMYTLTWITEKELELELKKHQTKDTNFVGRKFYSGGEKIRNASSHQGENEQQ